MTQSERESLLDEANRLTSGDRNNQYGPPTQDFERTAAMWSAMGFSFDDNEVKNHHVAMAMIALKLSRLSWNPDKRDSWVDVAGYSGCGWECVHEASGS